ncbi:MULTISPECIES: hypothetical protein [unclassified Burkholderia]|uniref:hypothetical protein n=1 Tax=unclassified Burkholderia TaxID=2613784 RepID=UPI002AAF33EB|nr:MULTISPECIES: hypothetical protein [unclassified Burkholderia]
MLLDDGEFYIERNCNYDAATANGFLQRRCAIGRSTPGGYECIGSYERNVVGEWTASINAAYDEGADSDSRELGNFTTNLDAIAALWMARRDACCKH